MTTEVIGHILMGTAFVVFFACVWHKLMSIKDVITPDEWKEMQEFREWKRKRDAGLL